MRAHNIVVQLTFVKLRPCSIAGMRAALGACCSLRKCLGSVKASAAPRRFVAGDAGSRKAALRFRSARLRIQHPPHRVATAAEQGL